MLETTVDGKTIPDNISTKEVETVPVINIPLPQSNEQLNQLIYRYRAITSNPKDNIVEISAIENVLAKISNEHALYLKNLNALRESITKVEYDNAQFNRQLLALQLLEKDLDIPDHLLMVEALEDVEEKKVNGAVPSTDANQLKQIKLSLDFTENAKNFGLLDSFSNKQSKLGTQKFEDLISQQIAKRINELEKLPANLGTYSLDDSLEFTTKDDLPSNIHKLKMKALVELKSLKLLTKQKSIRQKLISNVANQSHHSISSLRDSPFTVSAQRSVQVRSKVIVPQTARIAEELERQTLLEKRKKERNLHLQKIHSITDFVVERSQVTMSKRDRLIQTGKICLSAHGQIEKDEQRRIERTAKQRLAALKSNDEEAYLKLLDQTKDTRITQLLRQTNSFLDSLSQAVRVQQNEAKLMKGEEISPITDEERENIDYYEVAHKIKEKIPKQPSILVGGTLKEYQLFGLEWMVSLYNNHLNGILADEMGLGKTIQSISLITYLFETKQDRGPYLVIVPLSTITNWTLEFEKWAPSLNTIVYKGTPNQRRILQHQIKIGNFDVLLTTYEYIIKDRSLLAKHEWAHMIIDEGHRMKNAQSKLSYTIQHYYKTRNRLILTGTPLQNNLPELWALLNFVLPKVFNSSKTFEDWFNTPFANTGSQEKLELTEEETLLIIRRLHKVLRPFLLRRLKKEVEKDLPDKVEKVIKCKLSGLQQQLYQQMLNHNALFFGAGAEGTTKTGIKGLNNKIMQLRKICNHPFVFDEVEGVINPSRGNTDLLYRVAGKFELLDRVLTKFKATGHRVLMFFQMTQVMDIMEDFLRMRNLKYMRLDGSTKTEDRTGMLKDFNAPNSEYFCFLLSTRAGGLGLNLQTADTVIIFDTDWNPHQDLQAQDRAHRIGQKNEVRILRLITTDSVEEVILERAMQKLDIDGKVIQAGKFNNKSTAEEQEEFLRRLIESESSKVDDDDQAELDDEELNEILARSEEEKILFDKMDQERKEEEERLAKANGLKEPLPRLIQTDELPAVFTENIEDHLQTEPVAVGRIRQTKRVYYDDGLTEEQFLEAVEDESVTLEEAIKRKRESREKRRRKKEDIDELDEENHEIRTLENTPDEVLDTYNVVDEKSVEDESPKKVNGRSRTRPTRKRTSMDLVDTTEDIEDHGVKAEGSATIDAEPEKKRPKFKITLKLKGQQETEDNVVDGGETPIPDGDKKPKNRSKSKPKRVISGDIKPLVEKLLNDMRQQLDETDAHPLTSIFEKLPSKKLYPDYYTLIENPTALETILRNCRKGLYKTMDEVKGELNIMYKNAKFYNEEGSWVYNDADKLNKYTDEWFQKNVK
ncbi:hypothetical protein KAFR_0J01680 [Kazachstania africana CBS 2517]|uniref:Uncharacterized protein n=1 Tax=Kazachstania africana (strain ATCC 22294 / BCRC 22015 / CBS 2517 / CECT 1963 / NBRC 1671 / NRRL Y-8276) TaxID=1071382 RepID=H2B0T3_KAZAF|nr:hypothetical protein KAFR_0J01680 [Kazachstania africana CBS 2517]CCF60233.1 hypothetical protein KAFR_0J01680 [Kazachstania africana CBS 2517]